MDAFIKDVVDFTRNVRQEIDSEEVDLNKMLEEVISMQQESNVQKKVKICYQVKGKGFYSDPMRIRIILNNLISNGIHYYDPNKENPFVKITAEINPDNCQIVVQDNGKGIREDLQGKVFDMFYRADNSAKAQD